MNTIIACNWFLMINATSAYIDGNLIRVRGTFKRALEVMLAAVALWTSNGAVPSHAFAEAFADCHFLNAGKSA